MANNNNNNIPKLIYITGIDGSGKSTVSEHLADQLRSKGYEVNILWLRFNHVFSKPLLGLCRLLGYTKYEKPGGIHVGYHDFYKSKIISYLFIFFQYLDAVRVKYTKILPLYRKKNSVIILDRYVYDILIEQTKSWWGKSIDSQIIKKFINIYIKYMKNDKETNRIIRTVKELFQKNISNSKQLGQLIDKYLVPQELEKKSNAEISTPFKLRQKK